VDKIRAYGIPTMHDVIYRTGHNMVLNWAGDAKIVLFSVLEGTDLEFSGTRYYKRQDDQNPMGNYDRFYPQHQPFFVEFPRVAVHDRDAFISVVGEPNSEYKIEIYSAKKNMQSSLSYYLDDFDLKHVESGTLSSKGFENVSLAIPEDWAVTDPLSDINSTCYTYKLYYKITGDISWTEVNNSRTTLTQDNVNAKYAAPIFDVLSEEPEISGLELSEFAAPNRIANGVSEY